MKKVSVKYSSIVASGPLLLLSFSACGESVKAISDNNDSNAIEDQTSDNTILDEDLGPIEDIISTDDWKKFKSFWNFLSEIDKNVDTTDTWNSFHSYNNTLSDDLKLKLAAELDSAQLALSNLMEDGVLKEAEYKVLKSITNERYQYITEGYGYIFMTRMMPPPGIYDRVDLMEDLEARIDTLQDLKSKNRIDDALYTNALEIIQQDIEKFALTEYSNGYYSFRTSIISMENSNDSTLFEKYYVQFEKDYQSRMKQMIENNNAKEYIQEAEEKHTKDVESMQKLQESLSTIRLLVFDLQH